MSSTEIVSKIERLREWEQLLTDAQQEVESLKDEIKHEMETRGVEELEAGQYIARFTKVVSSRLDTTAMKKAIPQIYAAYTKQTTSRRFTISG